MTERPRFFDDLAGVAGGALSVLGGLRDEAESIVRAQVDEAIRKLDLVRQSELQAVQDLAANARAEVEALRAELAALRAEFAASVAGRAPPSGPPVPG